jgi:hypothetical protein
VTDDEFAALGRQEKLKGVELRRWRREFKRRNAEQAEQIEVYLASLSKSARGRIERAAAPAIAKARQASVRMQGGIPGGGR